MNACDYFKSFYIKIRFLSIQSGTINYTRKNNDEKKLFSLITVTILAICFALPSFAASATYDFTMVNRVVNGKDNSVYHTLSAGTAHMNGSSFTYSSGHDSSFANVDVSDKYYLLIWKTNIWPHIKGQRDVPLTLFHRQEVQ